MKPILAWVSYHNGGFCVAMRQNGSDLAQATLPLVLPPLIGHPDPHAACRDDHYHLG